MLFWRQRRREPFQSSVSNPWIGIDSVVVVRARVTADGGHAVGDQGRPASCRCSCAGSPGIAATAKSGRPAGAWAGTPDTSMAGSGPSSSSSASYPGNKRFGGRAVHVYNHCCLVSATGETRTHGGRMIQLRVGPGPLQPPLFAR